MSEDSKDLSPWAHPKAQKWFETLLERSGFINEVEDNLQHDEDLFELSHGRMLLALLILLGREGIWPESKKRVLQRAASKINAAANRSDESSDTKRKKTSPLTVDEHRRKSAAKAAISAELELLRRRAGMSNLKRTVPQPNTWNEFWS